MKIKVVVHKAEEGGFWAEVPAIPGCATQGATFEELLGNLYEAVEACLSVDVGKGPYNFTAQQKMKTSSQYQFMQPNEDAEALLNFERLSEKAQDINGDSNV